MPLFGQGGMMFLAVVGALSMWNFVERPFRKRS
jgi:hypothetical protein